MHFGVRIQTQSRMASLLLQRRLAASVKDVGKRRIWLDPDETKTIALASSRKDIRKLFRDGVIVKKPTTLRSRSRVRAREIAKIKGRRRGLGKRKGARNARTNPKTLWIAKIRVLRRLLKKYRDSGKIDRHLYRELYVKAKGNMFRNKKNLLEHIWRAKEEKTRVEKLNEQNAIRLQKSEESKKKKIERRKKKIESMLTANIVAPVVGNN